jgi:uncharacterized protein
MNIALPGVQFLDSLINLVSGLGTARDKAVHTRYAASLVGRDQLDLSYRGDWIARKVVDLPAQDSTREWRLWQAEDDQIEKLETTERKFDIQGKVRRAMIRARLYGGAALVMGIKNQNSFEPLKLERVGKDSLQFVHVLSQHELNAGEVEGDVLSEFYGEPKFYEHTSLIADGSNQLAVKIHPSRIVKFIGCEIPDLTRVSGNCWGDSVIAVVNDAILAAGSVAQGIAALVQEAKSDVIRIPELSKHLSTQEYTDLLVSRLSYAAMVKSMTNTRVLDEKEEWEQFQINFSTLPDVLKMYLLIASGAADIPATRMLGQSPIGMNATGESDIRNYYDRISSDQEVILRPALSRLDEVIHRSALGKFDDNIYYEWKSLWQMTDTERADIAVKKATVFTSDVNNGLINPEALRVARENQLIEDATYPGFEAALEEFPDEELPTPEEEMQQQVEMAKAMAGAKNEGKGNVVPFKQKKKVADSFDDEALAMLQYVRDIDPGLRQ